MQACTQWTHSDIWSQLATTPECLFTIGDRQSEKKQRNSDWRAICNVMRGIDAGRGVIRHLVVADGANGARPLWRSQYTRTEMFFVDGYSQWSGSLARLSGHWRSPWAASRPIHRWAEQVLPPGEVYPVSPTTSLLNSSGNTLDRPLRLRPGLVHRPCGLYMGNGERGTAHILQGLENRITSNRLAWRWRLLSISAAGYPSCRFDCTSSIWRCRKSGLESSICLRWSGNRVVTWDSGLRPIWWPG